MRSKFLISIFGFIFIFFLFLYSANSQNIPRRAFIGIKVAEISDSVAVSLNLNTKYRILISDVISSSASFLAGVMKNDILVSINGIDVLSINDYRNSVKNIRESEQINFGVLRNNVKLTLFSVCPPLPYESSEKFDVLYEEAKFKDGFLRLIINKPNGDKKFPAIFFIPGYMCYSLDNIGKHPYGQLVEGLCEKGYAVIRCEKPGTGDCYNTPDCFDIDYLTELEAFDAGLNRIFDFDYIDKENIFIFGHSLGGYQAPMIDTDGRAKGIIVCGTGLKSWFEYIIEMFRFQNIIAGADYIENEIFIHKIIPVLYDYLIAGRKPSDIAINDSVKSLMQEYLEYDNDSRIWSRHYSFWQQVQRLNLPQVWKNTKGKVLVIRGEGDFEAFSDSDHIEIVNIINFYTPGRASFIKIPNMDHGFAKSKTPAESFKNKSIKGFYYDNFNRDILDTIDNWIISIK